MADYRVTVTCNGVTVEGIASTPTPVVVAPNPTREINTDVPLIITSSGLPAGVLSSSYSVTLTATDGLAPYTWAIVSGTLPAGLTLSSGGVLSGTPTEVANRPLVIGVTDQGSRHGSKSFTLSVGAAASPNFGPRFNDWVLNKTSGTGGDYPLGDVALPAGTYYVDPFDLSTSGYVRAFNASKPHNNWLRITERDGAGTVFFDLRPESAASALGQTPTAAYNDSAHGGAFRAVAGTSGSVRWSFDAGIVFQNGSIHSGAFTTGSAGFDRLIFHGTSHKFSITEWLRQYKIIAALRGVTDPGSSIPNDSPSALGLGGSGPNPDGGPYWQVYNADTRWKGNTQPTPFRLDSASRISILRADIGPAGDDCVFVGSGPAGAGCDRINIVGTVGHDNGVTNIATIGPAADWFHCDVFQVTGPLSNSSLVDSTVQGHLNIASEAGTVSTLIIDRIWQGANDSDGGSLYNIGHTMGSTNKWGTGAPTIRMTGHYVKGFSNGTGHRDGGTQGTITVGANGWHYILVSYDSQPGYGAVTASLANFSVAVPTGVTVDSDGFITSGIPSFLASTAVPHQLFRAAYTTAELAAVMTDYSIAYD